jgi:hypothetical protein
MRLVAIVAAMLGLVVEHEAPAAGGLRRSRLFGTREVVPLRFVEPAWTDIDPVRAFDDEIARESRDVLDESAWLVMPDELVDDDFARDQRGAAARRILRRAAGRAVRVSFCQSHGSTPAPRAGHARASFDAGLPPRLTLSRTTRSSDTRLHVRVTDGVVRLQRDRSLPTPIMGSERIATVLRVDPTDESVRLVLTLSPSALHLQRR